MLNSSSDAFNQTSKKTARPLNYLIAPFTGHLSAYYLVFKELLKKTSHFLGREKITLPLPSTTSRQSFASSAPIFSWVSPIFSRKSLLPLLFPITSSYYFFTLLLLGTSIKIILIKLCYCTTNSFFCQVLPKA